MTEKIRNRDMENARKAVVFVNHVQRHLDNHEIKLSLAETRQLAETRHIPVGIVGCKICEQSIDRIYASEARKGAKYEMKCSVCGTEFGGRGGRCENNGKPWHNQVHKQRYQWKKQAYWNHHRMDGYIWGHEHVAPALEQLFGDTRI